jgi:hypothetical protein
MTYLGTTHNMAYNRNQGLESVADVYPRSAYKRVILLAANMGGEPSKCLEMGTDTTGNCCREGDFHFIPGSSFGFYLQQAVLSFLAHARISHVLSILGLLSL